MPDAAYVLRAISPELRQLERTAALGREISDEATAGLYPLVTAVRESPERLSSELAEMRRRTGSGRS